MPTVKPSWTVGSVSPITFLPPVRPQPLQPPDGTSMGCLPQGSFSTFSGHFVAQPCKATCLSPPPASLVCSSAHTLIPSLLPTTQPSGFHVHLLLDHTLLPILPLSTALARSIHTSSDSAEPLASGALSTSPLSSLPAPGIQARMNQRLLSVSLDRGWNKRGAETRK